MKTLVVVIIDTENKDYLFPITIVNLEDIDDLVRNDSSYQYNLNKLISTIQNLNKKLTEFVNSVQRKTKSKKSFTIKK